MQYSCRMELNLTPETEAKLSDLAQRTHRDTAELLEEAVNYLVLYNDWLEHRVKDSLSAAGRGEVVFDADVQSWIERRERR